MICRQILKGVDFIHTKRILHLDLKPQNIVLVQPWDPTSNLNESTNSALSHSQRSISAVQVGGRNRVHSATPE